MTQEHPITPPPELLEKWEAEVAHTTKDEIWHVAVQAARWGADQELEACCKLLELSDSNARDFLYSARRPKPPSLKELALQALYRFDDTEGHEGLTPEQIADDFVLIRRALESLPD